MLRALLRLLLLLLLLAAHPLQFLQELLRSFDASIWSWSDLIDRHRRTRHHFSGGRIAGDRRSVVLIFILLLLLSDDGGLGGRSWFTVAHGKLQLARSAGIGAAEHEDVVTRTVEQIGEDRAWVGRTIDAEDALVFRKPIDRHSCLFGQLMEDVAEA